jgi:adenylate cyclase
MQEEPTSKILVVDDHELNRDLLRRRLGKQGYDVDTAEDGAVALQMLEKHGYDLVLLDIMMPEKNGYEVLEEMKAHPEWAHLPVIMISALTELDGIARCIEMGADDYLPKPFKSVLLQARVVSCLEKKKFRDQQERWMEQLEREKKRADDLLKVILPLPVIEELKATNAVKPRSYNNVAVLFTDIVNFTSYCNENSPEKVVAGLQTQVTTFEELTIKHGIQKIKTIGDAFMGTAGLFTEMDNPVLACIECGLEMIEANRQANADWKLRVGIAVGPVMGGIVGSKQYLFDVWGDTVNTASRMEEAAGSNCVAMTQEAWDSAKVDLDSVARTTQVKGKGALQIYEISSAPPVEMRAAQGC